MVTSSEESPVDQVNALNQRKLKECFATEIFKHLFPLAPPTLPFTGATRNVSKGTDEQGEGE